MNLRSLNQGCSLLLVLCTLAWSACESRGSAESDAGAERDREDATTPKADGALGEHSCEESWRLAAEEVWQIEDAADTKCSADADCMVYQPQVSCSEECPALAVSEIGRETAEAAITKVEAERCSAAPAQSTCARTVEHNCADPSAFLAFCREGQCRHAMSGCSGDCTAETIGGICHGASHCDGCPSILEDAVGKACDKPQQTCAEPGWCPPMIECSDEETPGEFRWVRHILLC